MYTSNTTGLLSVKVPVFFPPNREKTVLATDYVLVGYMYNAAGEVSRCCTACVRRLHKQYIVGCLPV